MASLTFLTGTKLLVGLSSGPYGTTDQGFYLYDVSMLSTPQSQAGQPCYNGGTGCYDDNGNKYGAGPTYVTWYHTSNHPLAAAYIP